MTHNSALRKQDVNDHLRGSYNEQGIERWWDRPRTQLGGMTPNEAWPTRPEEVMALAEGLSAANGTFQNRRRMSFWDTPDGKRALEARAMDRNPLYEAMEPKNETYGTGYLESEIALAASAGDWGFVTRKINELNPTEARKYRRALQEVVMLLEIKGRGQVL